MTIYATHPTQNEDQLLRYFKTQAHRQEQFYDAYFALRLCITHQRVWSAVHIYTTMKQYTSAVNFAAKYNETELAAEVSETPSIDDTLRKNLRLKIANKIIQQNKDIKPAPAFLRKRNRLLRIEDLLPLFKDFVIIDDCKKDIFATLQTYSRVKTDRCSEEGDRAALEMPTASAIDEAMLCVSMPVCFSHRLFNTREC